MSFIYVKGIKTLKWSSCNNCFSSHFFLYFVFSHTKGSCLLLRAGQTLMLNMITLCFPLYLQSSVMHTKLWNCSGWCSLLELIGKKKAGMLQSSDYLIILLTSNDNSPFQFYGGQKPITFVEFKQTDCNIPQVIWFSGVRWRVEWKCIRLITRCSKKH